MIISNQKIKFVSKSIFDLLEITSLDLKDGGHIDLRINCWMADSLDPSVDFFKIIDTNILYFEYDSDEMDDGPHSYPYIHWSRGEIRVDSADSVKQLMDWLGQKIIDFIAKNLDI